jgi:hypothetical protein
VAVLVCTYGCGCVHARCEDCLRYLCWYCCQTVGAVVNVVVGVACMVVVVVVVHVAGGVGDGVVVVGAAVVRVVVEGVVLLVVVMWLYQLALFCLLSAFVMVPS